MTFSDRPQGSDIRRYSRSLIRALIRRDICERTRVSRLPYGDYSPKSTSGQGFPMSPRANTTSRTLTNDTRFHTTYAAEPPSPPFPLPLAPPTLSWKNRPSVRTSPSAAPRPSPLSKCIMPTKQVSYHPSPPIPHGRRARPIVPRATPSSNSSPSCRSPGSLFRSIRVQCSTWLSPCSSFPCLLLLEGHRAYRITCNQRDCGRQCSTPFSKH